MLELPRAVGVGTRSGSDFALTAASPIAFRVAVRPAL